MGYQIAGEGWLTIAESDTDAARAAVNTALEARRRQPGETLEDALDEVLTNVACREVGDLVVLELAYDGKSGFGEDEVLDALQPFAKTGVLTWVNEEGGHWRDRYVDGVKTSVSGQITYPDDPAPNQEYPV